MAAIQPMEPRLLLTRIVYVDDSAPAGGNGTNWVSAYRDLQSALANPQSGDEIHVGQGTYRPTTGTTRGATFQLKSGVALYGGYAGYGAAIPDQRSIAQYATTLSGDIGTTGLSTDNAYHVVTANNTDASALLDGFTITAGTAVANLNGSLGGGLYIDQGSPTVSNCTLSGNTANLTGGAVYINNHASPTFTACTFSGNHATSVGGAVDIEYYSSPSFSSCMFIGNSAKTGGGIYNGEQVTLSNCSFVGNSAGISNTAGSGGGLYNKKKVTATGCSWSGNWAMASGRGGGICDDGGGTFTNCSISGNWTGDSGGGGGISAGGATLTNCTIQGNWTGWLGCGGGISGGSVLTNCTIQGNWTAGGWGGGICTGGSPTLTGCTFAGNSAGGSGLGGAVYISYAPGTLAMTNCVLVGNSTGTSGLGGAIYSEQFSPIIRDCTLAGNVTGTSGFGGAFYNNGSAPVLVNDLVWGNLSPSGSQIYNKTGNPAVAYCDVQGGFPGTANTDADPQFVRSPGPGTDKTWGTPDDDYGDLRLLPTSPCIDAGSNAAVPASITTDLAGNPRFVNFPDVPSSGDTGPVVDMGAYEAPNPDLSLSSAGSYYLSLSPDHASLQIWPAAAPIGTPIVYAPASLNSLHLAGTTGDDTVTIDLSNGSPLPSAGLTFDGGTGADTLILTGTSAVDSLTIGSAQIILSSATITLNNIESTLLDNSAGALVSLGSLTLTDAGRLSLPSTGGKVLKVGTLAIADTATLDLGTNSLIVQADTGTLTPDDALSQVGDWMARGRIIAPAGACRGLAAIRNERGDGIAAMGRFEQQDVNTGSILVRYTLNGDTDLSGKLDASDYLRLDYGFLTGKSTYRFGDFNRDRQVTADDYGVIDAAFLGQTAIPAGKVAAAVAPRLAGTAAVRAKAPGQAATRRLASKGRRDSTGRHSGQQGA